MEKFTTLFKNDSLEIVQVDFRCRNGKLRKSWYVDFGLKDQGIGCSSICCIDFDTKAKLKEFIKSQKLESYFSKMFLKS